jgi:hypothetical protein
MPKLPNVPARLRVSAVTVNGQRMIIGAPSHTIGVEKLGRFLDRPRVPNAIRVPAGQRQRVGAGLLQPLRQRPGSARLKRHAGRAFRRRSR